MSDGNPHTRSPAQTMVTRFVSNVGKNTLGVTLVIKLRAILLMEGDYNATNKIVYGNCMIKNAREHHLMPKEIFSEKNRMAHNGTLCKTSF
jgi:hypothetical protein